MKSPLIALALALVIGCRSDAQPAKDDAADTADTGETAVPSVPPAVGIDWNNVDQNRNGIDDLVEGRVQFTSPDDVHDIVLQTLAGCVDKSADYVAMGERIDDQIVDYYWSGDGFADAFLLDRTGDGLYEMVGFEIPEPGIWRNVIAKRGASTSIEVNNPDYCNASIDVSTQVLETKVLTFTECGRQVVNGVDAITEDGYWWNAKTDAEASRQARTDCN